MQNRTVTTRAAALGRATAFSMIALLGAGGCHPAQAQKPTAIHLTGPAASLLTGNPSVLQDHFAVWVQSPAGLASKLQDPQFKGNLMIPRDAAWDMTGYHDLPLRSGVSVLGQRGALGSRPLLYVTDRSQDVELFDVTGNDVRIEGLHLRGPEAGNLDDNQKAARAIFIHEDADHQLGRNILIADNELNEWTTSGVEAKGAHGDAVLPSDYDPSWAVLRPEDAGLVRVEGNYIHNNGRGYGVVVDGGAYVTIEGNVFDYNWHDVASDGTAHSGYVAQYNYVLEGGFTYDGWLGFDYYNQHFDVHGTAASGDHHNGGTAGEYYLIANNTIRGDQSYDLTKNRPAFELRGRPAIGAFFENNVLVHSDSDAAIRLDTGDDSSLDDDNPSTFNLHASGNQFGTDHSTEIAAGDFDGDGRTDVFLATGTAWFYSRGGSQPWTYLQPSDKLTRDLAFADIDNDGITDVLFRGPDGTLSYWKGGKGAPVGLTHVPVPVSELRFGDFDGDGKTDIFYTQGGNWNFWYSRTRSWGSPGGSSFPLSDLQFGDIDHDGRTDILGVSDGHWSYSSSGTQTWTAFNSGLTNSFANAVVGDFTGTGRTDVLYSSGNNWYISRGATAPPRLYVDGGAANPYASVKSLLLGHFDGGTRAEFVSFERTATPRGSSVLGGLLGYDISVGNRLVIWRDAGAGRSFFSPLSPQEMR